MPFRELKAPRQVETDSRGVVLYQVETVSRRVVLYGRHTHGAFFGRLTLLPGACRCLWGIAQKDSEQYGGKLENWVSHHHMAVDQTLYP